MSQSTTGTQADNVWNSEWLDSKIPCKVREVWEGLIHELRMHLSYHNRLRLHCDWLQIRTETGGIGGEAGEEYKSEIP